LADNDLPEKKFTVNLERFDAYTEMGFHYC